MITSDPQGARKAAFKPELADDAATLEQLARYGEVLFTEAETATAMNVPLEQLTDLFSRSQTARRAFEGARLRTLETLRKAQFKHAQTNASMAIYLGRTHLGQSEQREGADGAAPAFDLSGASRRLRDKLAAFIVSAPAPEDPAGD